MNLFYERLEKKKVSAVREIKQIELYWSCDENLILMGSILRNDELIIRKCNSARQLINAMWNQRVWTNVTLSTSPTADHT